MTRREFVRKIEVMVLVLAHEADLAINLTPEHLIDAQLIADDAAECIEKLRTLIVCAVKRGTITMPSRLVASPAGL